MASKLKTIMAQVVTQLKTANGSGVYTYDLSATGTVIRGAVLEPPQSSPSVGVFMVPMDSAPGVRLGFSERTQRVAIHGWIASDGTEGDAEDTAADLLNDILRALEADRTLDSKVRDITLTGSAFSGTTYGWDGWAVVALDMEFNYSLKTGV